MLVAPCMYRVIFVHRATHMGKMGQAFREKQTVADALDKWKPVLEAHSQKRGPAKLVSQAFLLTLLLGFFYYRYVSSLNRSLILCDSLNQHSCKDKICFWPVCEFSVCLLQFCRTECFRTHFLSNDPFVMSSHLSRNIVGSVFVQALRPSLFFCAFPRS